jgi:membrane fusion protein, multidrug efflux system
MAVLKMQGSNDRYLFVDENGVARRIAVTVGKRYDDNIEVFSDDLNAGDTGQWLADRHACWTGWPSG